MTNDKENPALFQSENSQAENKVSSRLNPDKENFYGEDWQDRPRPNRDRYSALAAQYNLETPQRKGFVRQWVIDKERRVFDARGWRPVRGVNGEPMRAVMNHKTVKEPEYGTYMEIPEVYFQENLKEDDAIRKSTLERRINNEDIVSATLDNEGNLKEQTLDKGNFYTPKAFGKNKIEKNN